MIYGFSGTRDGMTQNQQDNLYDWLRGANALHHGDCVGADAQADLIALRLGVPRKIHPPNVVKYREFCQPWREGDELLPEDDYHACDRAIVKACNVLLAAPKHMTEQEKGGTWYTVRYARSLGKPIIILWPNGTSSSE